jgi:hypothetical protein
MQPQDFLTLA